MTGKIVVCIKIGLTTAKSVKPLYYQTRGRIQFDYALTYTCGSMDQNLVPLKT